MSSLEFVLDFALTTHDCFLLNMDSATVSNDFHVATLDMQKKNVASQHELNPCPFLKAD